MTKAKHVSNESSGISRSSAVTVLQVSTFRNNLNTYLKKAKVEKIKVHSPSAGDFYIVPASELEFVSYNPDFIEKIKRGRKEFETSGGTTVELEDLWE